MSGGGHDARGASGRVPSNVFDNLKKRIDPAFEDLLKFIDERADNPFIQDVSEGQEDLLKKLGGMSGQLDALPNQLKRTALASTDAGAVAAAQAAKNAGAGRGGAAFGGGGATAVATRAAAGAATAQSAALASALVQGEQARSAFELNLGSLQGNVTDSLTKGKIAQAGLFEQRQGAGLNARTQFLNILGEMGKSGIAGTGGSPEQRSKSRGGSGGVAGGGGK